MNYHQWHLECKVNEGKGKDGRGKEGIWVAAS